MSRPIICFEGASSVGKSTLCRLFSKDYYIVPGVNELFPKEKSNSEYWYVEKQVERYRLADRAPKNAILDGDIFQPIWYNWVYEYPANFLSEEATHEFYRTKIEQGQICFPDLYIVLYAEEEDLRFRKEHDASRSRRNFAKHLQFIEPQKRYFQYLNDETIISVAFISSEDLTITQKRIASLVDACRVKERNDLLEFDKIMDWLARN